MSLIHINELRVRGPAECVAEFITRNQSSWVNEDGRRIHMPLSFAALVPYPPELALDLDFDAESLCKVLYGTEEQMLADIDVAATGLTDRKALTQYFAARVSADTVLVEQYRVNLQAHGHATLHTWLPDKWGPSHDLGDPNLWNLHTERVSAEEFRYQFDTNWSVPDGWLMAVAPLFPELELRLSWECPEAERTGVIVYQFGRQRRFIQRDMWLTDDDEPDSPHGSFLALSEFPNGF